MRAAARLGQALDRVRHAERSAEQRETAPHDVRVDDDGISARGAEEVVLDLLLDGRRIFSFWLHRDGERRGSEWFVAWPRTLREFLDGHAVVSVVVHATGQRVFDEQVRFGDGQGPVAVVHPETGQPLSLDKSWRRVVTFDTRSASNTDALMRSVETVLDLLREAGIEPFIAYGTLLGAVREGRLLGHDSDADLAYVSRFSHPAEVIGESFRVQRALLERGYRITRYSALAFKVDVDEGDGVTRGLDVFGGFFLDGHLHLMGEIRVPFEPSWVRPLGTAVLEGRTLAVPADADRVLAATYGPSWRVPDPAFKFETPDSTHRRLDGWFRGMRTGQAAWDRLYSQPATWVPDPSSFASFVAEQEPGMTTYVDVGCGRGADVLWMARRGVRAVGLDFQPRAFAKAQGKEVEGASFETVNLSDLRQLLSAGAAAARLPGPRVVAARHLVDVLGAADRARLWRLARMTLAGPDATATGRPGRLHLEFLARAGEDRYDHQHHLVRRRPTMIVEELNQAGATVVHREKVAVSAAPGASVVCRIIAEWSEGR